MAACEKVLDKILKGTGNEFWAGKFCAFSKDKDKMETSEKKKMRTKRRLVAKKKKKNHSSINEV